MSLIKYLDAVDRLAKMGETVRVDRAEQMSQALREVDKAWPHSLDDYDQMGHGPDNCPKCRWFKKWNKEFKNL